MKPYSKVYELHRSYKIQRDLMDEVWLRPLPGAGYLRTAEMVNSTNESLDEAHSSPGLHAAAGPGLAEECVMLGLAIILSLSLHRVGAGQEWRKLLMLMIFLLGELFILLIQSMQLNISESLLPFMP
ncbi:hypothetical protein NE237_006480 [Protea cynaroides]|uniref:Uncharacterized protein n=1 Tax=Protea cynaroides TaxID=273540 RepID=A0A9Q0KN68_9MAGN|nr:hypothetical protein NE237_006480 [Protea cynaroides]